VVLTSLFTGRLVSRTGRYKVVIVSGLVLLCLGLFLLRTLTVESTLGGIGVRTFIFGCGMGPVLPMLTLSIQNAVPAHQVGTATASRQFFQQLGQAVGSAVFGMILTSTLAHALTDTLGPVRREAPVIMHAQFDRWFDPERLRNGGVVQESPGEGRAPAGYRLADRGRAEYEARRREPSADAEALAREEAQALALCRAGEQAVRVSFARAVTRVYDWCLPLGLCALLLALFTREIPLRKGNAPAPAPVGD
jgi:hypothetical protein